MCAVPYIDPERRKEILCPETAGELNWLISAGLDAYVKGHGLSYQTLADCISALEGAKLEFYRRVVGPYEDKKIEQNGDVYSRQTLGETE